MKSRSVLESKLSRANIKANILEQICDLVLDTTPAGESSIRGDHDGSVRRDDNEQVTYDLTVLFSLIFVLNL